MKECGIRSTLINFCRECKLFLKKNRKNYCYLFVLWLCYYYWLPRWFSGKEYDWQCRRCKRHGFSPWVEKIPWRREWQITLVYLLEKFHGQSRLVDYNPWGHKDSDMTEHECMGSYYYPVQFSSVTQSCLTLCDPWTAAHQASLSITNSQSLLKLMSIESVTPFNHLIPCHPLLLPHSIFPSIRDFSNESVLGVRFGVSASASVLLINTQD